MPENRQLEKVSNKVLEQELQGELAVVGFNLGIINTEMLQSCSGSNASSYEEPSEWVVRAADKLESLKQLDNGKSLLG